MTMKSEERSAAMTTMFRPEPLKNPLAADLSRSIEEFNTSDDDGRRFNIVATGGPRRQCLPVRHELLDFGRRWWREDVQKTVVGTLSDSTRSQVAVVISNHYIIIVQLLSLYALLATIISTTSIIMNAYNLIFIM